MIKRENIKEVLNFGFKIEFPYKSEINQWYSNISINKYRDYYEISPMSVKFYDIDEAVDYFLKEAISSKNKGYIQNRLNRKYDLEEYNLEKPDEELKKLFEDEGKIVDEEFKELNINIKKFPKAKDAVKDFDNIIKNFNFDTIRESIKDFERKYSMLDTYFFVSSVFEPDGPKYTHEYRNSFDYEELTLERIEYTKSQIKDYKFKNLEITLKLRGDEEYHRYEINI